MVTIPVAPFSTCARSSSNVPGSTWSMSRLPMMMTSNCPSGMTGGSVMVTSKSPDAKSAFLMNELMLFATKRTFALPPSGALRYTVLSRGKSSRALIDMRVAPGGVLNEYVSMPFAGMVIVSSAFLALTVTVSSSGL